MLSYCLKRKKNTENINPTFTKASNGKTMILSKCAICSAKKSRPLKKQEAKGLLTSLGFKTGQDQIPFLSRLSSLRAIPLKKDERIMYKSNVILLSKVQKKIQKHYSTNFKN